MKHRSLLVGPGASGSVGHQFTAAKVKGIGTLKAYAVPAYKNTPGQTTQRDNWKALVAWWHSGAPQPADKIAYNDRATKTRRGLSGWNLYMSIYRLIFSAGDNLQYMTAVTAVSAAPNLTVAGTTTINGNHRITVYGETGTFVLDVIIAAAALAFTHNFLLVDIPAKGWIKVEVLIANEGGETGWYHYVA